MVLIIENDYTPVGVDEKPEHSDISPIAENIIKTQTSMAEPFTEDLNCTEIS